MPYTIVLIEKPEGGIHVSVPALPDCTVEADTRDEAMRLAREAIATMVSRCEMVRVEVPQQPKTPLPGDAVPWAWFGSAEDDTTWALIFDEIEQNRDNPKGDVRPMYLWDANILRHFGQGHPTLPGGYGSAAPSRRIKHGSRPQH